MAQVRLLNRAVRPIVPAQLERLQATQSSPGVIGHYRHGITLIDDLADTWNSHRRLRTKRLDDTAPYDRR